MKKREERMVRNMKKVVLFLVFLALLVVIFMQPAVAAEPAPSHPIPVWSILCYLSVVLLFTGVAAWRIRGKRVIVKPKLA